MKAATLGSPKQGRALSECRARYPLSGEQT